MRIKKNFLKDVPLEKQDLVKKKLLKFDKLLPNKRMLSDIPKGFWIRNVVGTDIYKFRINSGDRILFKYEQIDGEETVVFLSFQSHDRQIRAAKAKMMQLVLEELEIDQEVYLEEPIDEEIDVYATTELYQHLDLLRHEDVFEDEYIGLVIEEEDRNVSILSIEQFDCLREVTHPVMIFGCAGSGKTNIAVRRLLMQVSLYGSAAYVTKSPLIIEKTRELLPEGEGTAGILTLTLKELLLSELNLEEATVIEYDDFENWMHQESRIPDGTTLSARDIWLEMNTVLKGNSAADERVMSKANYFASQDSYYDEAMRKVIYRLVNMYELWLKTNGYLDLNDLAYLALHKVKLETFTSIVVDEVQEFSNKQLAVLLRISANKSRLMLLGDIHQVTEHYEFDIGFLKQQLYKDGYTLKEYFIDKNYRSSDQTIELINKLKEIKFELFSHESRMFRLYDIPVRKGNRPALVQDQFDAGVVFSRLEQDADSIVVVSDMHWKQRLRDLGLKRVFTIEESRGLEYKDVYGYNLLSSFKEIWSRLLAPGGKNKANDLYRTYFNLIYLAITRSKDNLYFLESERTVLEEELSPYFDRSRPIEALLHAGVRESDRQKWLREAEKLYRLRNYEKAADAYQKADDHDKCEHCLKLANHKVLYDFSETYRSYIQLSTDKCSPKVLEILLFCIEQKYAVRLKGVVQMFVPIKPEHGGERRRIKGFLEPDWTHAEQANYLYDRISQSIFDRSEMTFVVTLFLDDEPIELRTLTNSKYPDIRARIQGSKVTLESTMLREQREMDVRYDLLDNFMKQHRSEIQDDYGFPYVEENKPKYRDATAENILNRIFQKE